MSELFSKSNDGQIRQNGLIMSTDEVIDYLNTSNNAIGSLQYENAKLRKENKRLKERNDELEEPVYYNSNGLSPNQAFEQGLISNEEFIGFIKGNVVKYVVRCGKKGNPIDDIDKAISYLQLLKKIMRFDDG